MTGTIRCPKVGGRLVVPEMYTGDGRTVRRLHRLCLGARGSPKVSRFVLQVRLSSRCEFRLKWVLTNHTVTDLPEPLDSFPRNKSLLYGVGGESRVLGVPQVPDYPFRKVSPLKFPTRPSPTFPSFLLGSTTQKYLFVGSLCLHCSSDSTGSYFTFYLTALYSNPVFGTPTTIY